MRKTVTAALEEAGNAGLEEATVELQVGQTLLLYTDGLPEAPNAEGHFFEMKGLERALRLVARTL